MSDRPICKSTDHLFVPILEVTVPLLRCIHCNVFAYNDTVKQLAKNRTYRIDDEAEAAICRTGKWFLNEERATKITHRAVRRIKIVDEVIRELKECAFVLE